MKKVFFTVAIFFLLMNVAWTRGKSEQDDSIKENPQKTSGWNFSVEPIFGVRFGKEGEIVWAKNSQTNDDYKLSELEWEYLPAFYFGGKAFSSYKRFEISFVSKFILPTHCGTMKDSDWLQDLCYETGNTSIKTNYSESENNIQKGYDLELAFAIKMYPTHFLTLRPRISVNYSYMEFSGIGGTYWYGDYNYYSYDSDKRKTDSLGNAEVIHYKTSNLYLWTGIQADFIPTKKLVLSIATEAAPLVYMISYDNHILTNIDFKQYSLSIFYAVRQSFAATYIFSNLFSLSFNFSAVLTGETMGPSFQKQSTEKNYIRDSYAGAYSKYLDFGISAKFSF